MNTTEANKEMNSAALLADRPARESKAAEPHPEPARQRISVQRLDPLPLSLFSPWPRPLAGTVWRGHG
jgi:hypothetical protein